MTGPTSTRWGCVLFQSPLIARRRKRGSWTECKPFEPVTSHSALLCQGSGRKRALFQSFLFALSFSRVVRGSLARVPCAVNCVNAPRREGAERQPFFPWLFSFPTVHHLPFPQPWQRIAQSRRSPQRSTLSTLLLPRRCLVCQAWIVRPSSPPGRPFSVQVPQLAKIPPVIHAWKVQLVKKPTKKGSPQATLPLFFLWASLRTRRPPFHSWHPEADLFIVVRQGWPSPSVLSWRLSSPSPSPYPSFTRANTANLIPVTPATATALVPAMATHQVRKIPLMRLPVAMVPR